MYITVKCSQEHFHVHLKMFSHGAPLNALTPLPSPPPPPTSASENIHPKTFTSIHVHSCFQSTQDPPSWMSLTTCSSLNYLGWFPPTLLFCTPLSIITHVCFAFFFFFVLASFSFCHISPGHTVVKIYERHFGSLQPQQRFPVPGTVRTRPQSPSSNRCHVCAQMWMWGVTQTHF